MKFVLIPVSNRRKFTSRGVYSSEADLHAAVTYWMKEDPNTSMLYEECEENNPNSEYSNYWSWAYVSSNSKEQDLSCVGDLPLQQYLNKNIVGINCYV